jgi:hypothetical protein
MGTLLAVVALLAGVGTFGVRAQNNDNEIVRRAKSKVQPEYPELARKMNLTGTVKVQVVVSPNCRRSSGAGGRGAGGGQEVAL